MFSDRRIISRSKYLQIQQLSVDQRTIYRSKKYRQIEVVFHLHIKQSGWRINCRSRKCSIFKLKNYLQIEGLSVDRRTKCISKFYSKFKKYSLANWRTIGKLKNYLQIKKVCADRRSISISNKYSFYRLKNYLHIKELSSDQRASYRLKKYVQIE